MSKERLSNVELLRILAILFVMIGHFHVRIDGLPDMQEVHYHPISSFFRFLPAVFSIAGVDVFVLISGWFGIKMKKEGLTKLIFQVLFLSWLVYGIAIFTHHAQFNVEGIKYSMGFYSGYWFVMAYLGLYILSPVLNAFVEHATKAQFQFLLVAFYLFQAYYSWLTSWVNYYDGYSIILFVGIYLTGRYMKCYPIKWIERHSIALYFLSVLSIVIILYFSTYFLNNAARQLRDDNPLVIFSSLCLLLSFTRFRFKNKAVNLLAGSCLAIYILHFNPYVYKHLYGLASNIYSDYSGVLYIFMLALFLLSVVLISFLAYQLYLFVYKIVQHAKLECKR